MAIQNFNMPVTAQNSHKFDIRTRPSKYALSDLRSWRFEQSEGIRPAELYAPYKNLPVTFKDVGTEDYTVIPKGRIVSALSTEDATPVSGIVYPSSSGEIAIGFAASELGGAKIEVPIDNSSFGYDEYICGLMVPCNGGTAFNGYYTAADVLAGTIGAGGVLATASGAFALPANAPIGVAFTDIYQDIRGKYLNYRMHPDSYHVLTDWYIEIPYIKADNSNVYASGCSPRVNNTDYANQILWYDVNSKFTYLAIEEGEETLFRNGLYVTSDLIGNYQPQAALTNASGIVMDSAYAQLKTNQTVGKILAIDNRMPKGALEDVLTYPRSGMPGSQTAGMIKLLFDFAFECMRIGPTGGSGTVPTVETVYRAIRSGAFGLARIQLLVS